MHNAGLASKMVDQHKTSIASTYFGHRMASHQILCSLRRSVEMCCLH